MNNLELSQPKQDFYLPDEEKIHLLQLILEAQRGEPVSFEDAEEVGIQLIALYECLARDREVIFGDTNG